MWYVFFVFYHYNANWENAIFKKNVIFEKEKRNVFTIKNTR